MTDELLPYYHRELEFFRRSGAEFAAANPKIAARLRLDENLSDDPHVERMIEAFAYLNARTRHKLEDDLPEITESLLGVLYPHYLAPIPSTAIIQFTLDSGQTELTEGHKIERGAAIETEAIEGEPCRFRACYDVTLWPIELTNASVKGHPFSAPPARVTSDAQAILHLQLTTMSENVTFDQLDFSSLRFFLKGQSQSIYDLYELLFNNTIDVLAAESPTDRGAVSLGKSCLQPVGFARDETLLDYSARSFQGYQMLSEYFACPEKFLFFDVAGLGPRVRSRLGNTLELFILLDRNLQDVEKNVDRDTFQLGCCPMVNLFRQLAEPIRLTHRDLEYRVVPDSRRPAAYEVYSVDEVVATSPDNERIQYRPFYSIKHGGAAQRQRTFWHAARRKSGYVAGQVDYGTEVNLSFVDLDFRPSAQPDWTIHVETTCLNRDLPARLPFGGNQPRLQMTSGGALARVNCLTPPRPTLRPSLRHGTLWRLISHLSLNHLSLGSYQEETGEQQPEEDAEALREILTLYDYVRSDETRAQIEGLRSIRCRRVVGRTGGAVSAGFCRGIEVTARFDEERYVGSGVFLFATVLERFLALYSSINSFSKLIAESNMREEAIHKWPPRAGEKVLL